MDRAYYSGAVATITPPPVAVSMGYPSENEASGDPTKPGPWWFYMITEEIRNVITMGGVTPNFLAVNQMSSAIQAAISSMGSGKANSSHTHSVSDIVGLSAWQSAHTHYFLTNSGTYATLDGTGRLTVTGDIAAFSDARLKTNVEVIDNALTKVKAIRGVTFDRIDSPESGRCLGVIAQEVLAVQPELVKEGADGNLSVTYGNITGLLIEAIKELAAEVAELRRERS